MFESLKKHRESEGGFTLIELLIVIVILGILAAVVIFSVTGINNNSKTAACKSDVQTIDSSAEAYYAQYQSAALSLQAIATAGLLHDNANQITAPDTWHTQSYDVTFTVGNATPGNPGTGAGSADTTVCP
jgi:general secretion pathway protein G